MFWMKEINSLDNLAVPNRHVEQQADVELPAVAFGRQSIDEHTARIVRKHVNGVDLERPLARGISRAHSFEVASVWMPCAMARHLRVAARRPPRLCLNDLFLNPMTTALARTAIRLIAAIAVATSTIQPALAQWPSYPWKNVPRTPDGKVDLKAPPRRTADGKIDLSGFWMPTDRVKHLLNLAADLKPGEVPLQPWAEAVYKERIETNGKDHPGVRLLAVGHSREAQHPGRAQAGADAGPHDLPARVAHHLPPDLHRRPAAARPSTRSRRGWAIRSAAGKATRSSSRPSGRTARPGSTCAGCPPPKRCASPSATRGRPSGASTSTSPSTIPKAYTKPWDVRLSWDLQPDTDLIESICEENNRDLPHMVGK